MFLTAVKMLYLCLSCTAPFHTKAGQWEGLGIMLATHFLLLCRVYRSTWLSLPGLFSRISTQKLYITTISSHVLCACSVPHSSIIVIHSIQVIELLVAPWPQGLVLISQLFIANTKVEKALPAITMKH